MNKTKYSFIFLSILFEVLLVTFMWGTEAKLTFLAGFLGIPCIFILIYFMFTSYKNALLISVFLIPCLPLGGYIFLRLGLLDYQWIFYVIFYLVSFGALIKNGLFSKIGSSKLNIKNKYIRIVLVILLIVNIIFAYNRQLSFMIITLSFVPFIIYIYLIQTTIRKNKKEFYDKILTVLSISVILISLPDFITFIMYWVHGEKLLRVFGPLGSNFLLINNLIIFCIILARWAKEEGFKNKWTAIVFLMAFFISMQMSRGAMIVFFLTMLIYLLFNVKNWKKYIVVLFIFGSISVYNVTGREELKTDSTLNNLPQIVNKAETDTNPQDKNILSKALLKIIETQSQSRQIIWKTGLELTEDYPYTGVGIGNFKYFFQEYSGSDRPYSDAHNVFLNMSSEIGVPFAVLSFVLLMIIGIKALIKYFKTKNKDFKLNYIAIMAVAATFFVYGNLTGINFQTTSEIYSFTPTFIILFALMYRDEVEEF